MKCLQRSEEGVGSFQPSCLDPQSEDVARVCGPLILFSLPVSLFHSFMMSNCGFALASPNFRPLRLPDAFLLPVFLL